MPDPATDNAPDISNPPTPTGAIGALGDNPPAQPAPPPKESFRQGFARGGSGEQYATDAQGNVVNTRATRPSIRGSLGSILAGAALGALHGATAARPGGIPSSELKGGVGEGAQASEKFFKDRDVQNREKAQQNLENRVKVQKATNEDLESKARIHIANLEAVKIAHDLDVAQREDPYRFSQLQNAATLANLQVESEATNLGLINPREYRDYSEVPQADIDKFNRHEVKIVTLPSGGVKVWDRTFDPKSTPNKNDFEVRDLTGFGTDGKPQWTVSGHVKAGQGTVAQQEAELDKETKQIYDTSYKNAETEKNKAEAGKLRAETTLTMEQVKNLKNFGFNSNNPNATAPTGALQMSSGDLGKALATQGVQVPNNFESLYAAAHYKADPNTFPTRTFNKPGSLPQMDRQTAVSFIRRFINPNYDESNFSAVKKLEGEFASTKPGSAGGNLVSFNAAVGHLGQLYEISQQLQNGQVPAWNEIANALSQQTGKAVKPNYEAIRAVLVGEAGRLFKQAAPDVKEMEEINKSLSSASSPEQFKGVTSAYAHAFLTKGSEQIQHYVDYTGELPRSTFSPNARKVLNDLGIDVNSILPQGAKLPGDAAGGSRQPAANVPVPVQKALSGVGPGRHTLSDGSVWDKDPSGGVTLIQPANPPQRPGGVK